MKNTTALLMALGLALPAMMFAQDEPRPPRRDGAPARQFPGGEGQRPPPPLVAALDANHDGVIDEDEIKNAAEALRKLDKNADGKLTMEELRPPRGDGPRAEGHEVPPGEDGERVGPRDGNRRSPDGAGPRRNPRPPEER
jgi:hypothetical protein